MDSGIITQTLQTMKGLIVNAHECSQKQCIFEINIHQIFQQNCSLLYSVRFSWIILTTKMNSSNNSNLYRISSIKPLWSLRIDYRLVDSHACTFVSTIIFTNSHFICRSARTNDTKQLKKTYSLYVCEHRDGEKWTSQVQRQFLIAKKHSAIEWRFLLDYPTNSCVMNRAFIRINNIQ